MQVMASDADDPTYGSSARVVYSVLEGEQHFTVDSKTGEQHPAGLGRSVGVSGDQTVATHPASVRRTAVCQQACTSVLAVDAGVPMPRAFLRVGEGARQLLPGSAQCLQQAAPWSKTGSCQPECPACACSGQSSSVCSMPRAGVHLQAHKTSV